MANWLARAQVLAALPEPASDPGVHRLWSIRFANLNPTEVIFHPAATRAEVAAIYPGARIEALLQQPALRTGALNELRELVALILANDSDADRAEALAVALADPDAALTSFRLLAHDIRQRAIWGQSVGGSGKMPEPNTRERETV